MSLSTPCSDTHIGQILNRLCKWRAHFAGWQLGTRTKEDPEAQAVRDHREATILLRVELNALTRALLEDNIINQRRFQKLVAEQARLLEEAYERRWPGVTASDDGMVYDQRAAESMAGWKP